MKQADAIVIGSGQGGVPLATELAKRGRHVVLFERDEIGGSCINYGCTPSKSFLAAAHNAGRARQAKNLGVRATVDVDFPFVMNRLRDIRQSFREEVTKRLIDAGVEIVRSEAAFTGSRVVGFGDVAVTAPLVVINTGTTATIPRLPGLAETPYITNTSFFAQTDLPQRFLVLGGGYIGLELGQGMARVGSKVTIFHNADRVLNNEEPDVSATLQDALDDDGIDVQLNANVSRVSFDGSAFAVEVEGGKRFEGNQFLVATGRTPNTAALHCERSSVALDKRGFVKIDAQFRTTCEGVYAIADAAGQPAFTHVSWEDHRRMLDILDGGKRTRDDRVLGYAVYTEPQVGRAGLTYDQAIAKGIRARKEEIPLSEVARAVEWGQERGFYRMVVDSDTDKIIGATLVGYEAAEIVHVFIAHMQAGSTWKTLDESVHVHPTYCEGLPTLARLFESK
ncbi:MAG TPA: FAD-dependent oxidoreductase [Candidatus Baltobacteraceae bacterium]|nr:FAD-dependent oxidoreductase [Candidatus Baltobacteraceae bacterium]